MSLFELLGPSPVPAPPCPGDGPTNLAQILFPFGPFPTFEYAVCVRCGQPIVNGLYYAVTDDQGAEGMAHQECG